MVVAECVGRQGRLLDYVIGLFYTEAPGTYAAMAADSFNLNKYKLNRCLSEMRVKDLINRHVLAARQLGLRGPSGILVDGFLVQPPFSLGRIDSVWSSLPDRARM